MLRRTLLVPAAAMTWQKAPMHQNRCTAPTFGEAFKFWLKLGFISFGGPTGQIAIMQTELVEKKRWISQSRFLHALNFCMLLPGPEAQQLAIYVGWLLHKTWGGIVAGAFFVIPSIFILWALSFVYAAYGNLPWIAAIFYGLKPAVMAIVAVAVIRIGRKALKNEVMWTLAVLPYVTQQALFHYGWLKPGQMMDGLGLAETTPGPLIMVLQFVGFMGGWQHPQGLSPLLAASLGALLTTWVTFTPCFLWIFLGGPYIEQLRGNPRLTAALSAITATIVGVVLNLAVWFGLRVFFPASGMVDWFAILLCAAAFVAMLRYKIDIIPVIIGSAIVGLSFHFLRGFR